MMTDDSTQPPASPSDDSAKSDAPSAGQPSGLPRREFLRVAGASAGLLLVGGRDISDLAPAKGVKPAARVRSASAPPDVVVIGAGGWGSFTALNLVQRGVKVTLVDAYGPGNARSTSGDETRGVRSSYGDRPGAQGELYKAEIIAGIPDQDEISLYGQGNWVDLCRGPHVP
jgi:hypothetical protein